MFRFLKKLAPYKKAVAGFVAPGVALFVADVTKDQALPTHNEWIAIGFVCVLSAVGVARAPKNAEKV